MSSNGLQYSIRWSINQVNKVTKTIEIIYVDGLAENSFNVKWPKDLLISNFASYYRICIYIINHHCTYSKSSWSLGLAVLSWKSKIICDRICETRSYSFSKVSVLTFHNFITNLLISYRNFIRTFASKS